MSSAESSKKIAAINLEPPRLSASAVRQPNLITGRNRAFLRTFCPLQIPLKYAIIAGHLRGIRTPALNVGLQV
jgi:hypothetical protein